MRGTTTSLKHITFICSAALILWGCGESGDTSNNATNNIVNDTNNNISSSRQTSNNLQDEIIFSSSSIQKETWNYLNPAISYETITDSRDGKKYKIVTIGNQVWMAENLNFETPNSYCYIDVTQECMKYGRLYTWNAAMTVCPSGWHLPSQAEWEILFNAVGGKDIACKNLKSSYNWNENGFGTNLFGFSALPAGYRDGQGNYDNIGKGAYFWHSTKDNVHNAIENKDFSYVAEIRLWYENEIADIDVFSALRIGENLDLGYSVRCLKDDISNTTSSSSAATISNSSNEISSSSSVKDKSSSSNKTLSSSSVSTGCKYERETRNIYFDDLYITDVCINGTWKYPSTSCDKKGTSIIETLETSIINGVSYTSYCSNNTLHFNKTCKEGDRDTITQNGTIEARVCTKYGIWSTIVSLSSSSQQSSASQQSSSSFSYQKCFNPNIQYGQMKDSRDGHIYKTVVIGSQTWMAENLNYLPNYYANYINTYEPLTNIHNPESKLFGCSDGLEKNCDITGRSYGKIVAFDSINYHDFYFRFDKESPCYNYTEFGKCYTKLIEYVTNKKGHFQGICPSGWHIPTTDEFTELLQYTHTGSSTGTGFWDDSPFKSTCQWPCYYKVGSYTCYNNGTDEFGFSLIPTGIYESQFDLHSYTHLWYITSYNGIMDRVVLSTLYSGGTLFGNSEFGSKTYGRGYVRCVKD